MKKIKIIAISIFAIFMLQNAHAQSGVYVPAYKQQLSNWCWAACSQMVHKAYKGYRSQCIFVAQSRNLENWYNPDCNNLSSSTKSPCHSYYRHWFNSPQALYSCKGSVWTILNSYGIPSYRYGRALTQNELTWVTHLRKVNIARWGWWGGGGHFVVVNQYKWGHVGFNNPLSGRNIWWYSTFKSANGKGRWTHTLSMKYGARFGGSYGSAKPEDQGPSAYQMSIPVDMENNSLEIYPNPGSTHTNLRFASLRTEPINLSITDVLGKVVYEAEVPSDVEFLPLDLSSWAKGAYLIRMQNSDEVHKLLVQ